MKNYKALKISGIVVLALVVLYFSSPVYVQRALVYQKVGIEDYPIFPNRTVEAGNPAPWEKHSEYNKKVISADLKSKMEEKKTIAFAVVRDGKLLHEEYWDSYGPESKTNSFSSAKSIVGLLVGCAIEDGFISGINEKVSKYFPEIKGKYSDNLTIKNVLNMSSGLNWDESYGSLFSTTTEAYYGEDLPKLILGLEVHEEPGKEFKYLSGNTQLLAMIVTKAVGEPMGEYATEKLWTPLQAEHDALWCLDKKNGLEKAYCCFNSNATDFARLGQLVLDSGRWNGQQIIPANYISESTNVAGYLKLPDSDIALDYYGYQWWIMNYKGHKIAYARGILGQYIFVIPSMNAVVVRLGHIRSKEYKDHHPTCAYTYLDAAFQILN
ncbi:MAG: serine hydrolase [Bacteroidota bacterium]|nr:serine hydrolase [Bacteroidota bacterium]